MAGSFLRILCGMYCGTRYDAQNGMDSARLCKDEFDRRGSRTRRRRSMAINGHLVPSVVECVHARILLVAKASGRRFAASAPLFRCSL